uniref:membrane protein insertase YidC n=1 Tax=Alistipes sp. TaxID=1872444 RepID=UPI004056F118
MDKQTITGIVLLVLIFFGFSIYNSKQQEKWSAEQQRLEAEAARADSIYRAEHPELAEVDSMALAEVEQLLPGEVDSLGRSAAEITYYGEELSAALHGESQTLSLENEVMTVEFTSLGARISDVVLKNYTKYAPKGERSELVRMFDPEASNFNLEFYIKRGFKNVPINTAELRFEVEPIITNAESQTVAFRLPLSEEATLRLSYTLYNHQTPERDYLLDFDVEFLNAERLMANQTSLDIDWKSLSYQNEKGFKNENMYTTLAYRFPGEDSIEDLGMSEGEEKEEITTSVNWVAFKQQFFSSVMIAYDNFTNVEEMRLDTFEPGSGYIKEFTMQAKVPYADVLHFGLYYGPNEYTILKKVVDNEGEELQLERMIPLGWGIFGWVNRWFVIPIFNLLRQFDLNFGLIILILAILVKTVIFPLTYKSYISMAKMRVIKPEMDALAAKYPKQEDVMKRQQATMELYKKAGINPMGGCLLMLIQMPILIAMFRFFPASIELRGQSFLWADDLSSFDSVLDLPFKIPFYGDHISLFALLMTIALFIYSYMNYQQTASQPQMPGMKFMMLYMMPIMMLLWFNDYASGLCFYYFLSNLLTMGQTLIVRRMVDDDKIRAIMEANANKQKNKKKSKFQLRYEEMMREQEMAARKKH